MIPLLALKHIDFFKRNGATKRLADFLRSQGDLPIVAIDVMREPLSGGVKWALDLLSLGRLDKKAAELEYDSIVHDSLRVRLSDGSTWKIEKNHVVEIKSPSWGGKAKPHPVAIPSSLTLNTMFKNAAINRQFWLYNAKNNNCQQFVIDMLTRNGLKTATELQKQNGEALLGALGKLSWLPKVITDVAAVGDRILHGDGLAPAARRRYATCEACGVTMLASSWRRHLRSQKHRRNSLRASAA